MDTQVIIMIVAVIAWFGHLMKFEAKKSMLALGFPATLTFIGVQYKLILKYLETNPLETSSAILVVGVVIFQFYFYAMMVFEKKKLPEVASPVPERTYAKMEDVVKRSKPLYKFTISSSEGTHIVKANHPDEVWGEIWSEDYPPKDAQIVEVVDNTDEDEES